MKKKRSASSLLKLDCDCGTLQALSVSIDFVLRQRGLEINQNCINFHWNVKGQKLLNLPISNLAAYFIWLEFCALNSEFLFVFNFFDFSKIMAYSLFETIFHTRLVKKSKFYLISFQVHNVYCRLDKLSKILLLFADVWNKKEMHHAKQEIEIQKYGF